MLASKFFHMKDFSCLPIVPGMGFGGLARGRAGGTYQDVGMQGHRDKGIQGYRDAEMRAHSEC